MIAYNVVQSGPYFGFTKLELKDELDRYKAQVKLAGSQLTGASQNGQSYTFGPTNDWSLSDWQMNIQSALASFGECQPAAPPATALDFRTGY